MLELVPCKSLAPKKLPLLRNGEHTSLMVLEGGREIMHVLSGEDRRANRISGQGRGYFALFEGENRPDAAALLFDGVAAFQRALGNEVLFGPVAPDASGFGMGVMVQGFEQPPEMLNPVNPEYYEALLCRSGFAPALEWLGFQLELDALMKRRYHEAADWAMARHQITVQPIDLWRGKPTYERLYAAMELDEQLSLGAFAEQIDAVRALSYRRLLLLASVRGQPAGVLLALVEPKSRSIRLATLHISRRFRRTQVALCLLGAFVENVRALKPERITASVIDANNSASLACVLGAGGQLCARWRQFERRI